MSSPAPASPKSPLTAWLGAARPKTLVAAVLPVIVGTALAAVLRDHWSIWLACLTLGSVLAIQIATNLFNDAIDFEKGADTEQRIGPRRATVSGDATGRSILIVATAFLALAALFGLPLILERGWPILAIGGPSLLLCYGYTGGPLPLAYLGLGELFVVLFFGLIAVTGTVFVHTGEWLPEAMVAGLQTGLLCSVLIEINNLRDREQDAAANKRTLAVRWGREPALVLLGLFLLAPYLIGVLYWNPAHEKAAIYPLATFPVGGFLIARVATSPPSPKYNAYLGLGALHFLLFEVLFCVGLSA